jgi:hypothetical protein
MNKNPLSKGVLTENDLGIGPPTQKMAQARSHELALIAGRVPPHVTQADYEQAKRELTDEPDMNRQEAMLESLPETIRSDPTPDSTGHQVPESPSEDEDDEGRSETEQLVDEGAEEAERDRMFQADHETEKGDRRGAG